MKNRIIIVTAAALAISGHMKAQAETLYGLSQNTLITFDSASPGAIGGISPITGLGADNLISLDLRPETGQLYALSSGLRLYTIDPSSGFASLVNPTAFGSSSTTQFGLDFNPVPDAIRAVNTDAQNFRVSTSGALLANDGTLAFKVGDPNFGHDPSIVAVAYSNNRGDATTTSLFGIDSRSDTLVMIAPPNDGVISTLGLLGVNTTEVSAFDISGVSGSAYASFTTPGALRSSLYQIDLGTGAASLVGEIGFASPLTGITAVPEPSTWALMGVGAIGLLARKFRRR